MKKWFCFILATTALSHVFGQNLFAAKAKGSYGFIDLTGQWIIPATFDDAEAFSNGYARVKKNGHWSYMDKNQVLITGFRFDKVYNFEGEVARVGIKDEERSKITYGLINTKGQWVGTREFNEIHKFDENGLALAEKLNGDWGFIDKSGRWVIQPTFGGLRDFHDGLAMARSKGKWGYIDRTGHWVIPPIYNHATSFQESLASVETKGGGWGLIDTQGKPVGARLFDILKPFSDSVTTARFEGRWGIVSKEGQWIVEPTFYYLDKFVDGLCRARGKDYFWGIVDKTGKWVIRPEFENVFSVSEGICRVHNGKWWGYMDRTGKWIVELTLQSAETFHNGHAIVKLKGKWGIIDRTGKMILEPSFDMIKPQREGDDIEAGEEADVNNE